MRKFTSKCTLLASKSQYPYVGIEIPSVLVDEYICDLRNVLSEREFSIFRANQSRRDRGKFHMTLIAPRETFENFDELFDISFETTLLGIGCAESGLDRAYYIVANCPKGDEIRDVLNLKKRDFHVTLGFDERDIHNVRKDVSTLLPPSKTLCENQNKVD